MNDNSEGLKHTVEPGVFKPWQQVDAEIVAFTDLGVRVVINHEYTGLVYNKEVYDDYQLGDVLKAYIKNIREDGKIDVSFRPNLGSHILSTADNILAYLKKSGGESRFNDKSSPEAIKREFHVSKLVFKRAIGHLYKQGKIVITDHGITCVK